MSRKPVGHTPEPWKLRGNEIGKTIASEDQNNGMMLSIAFVDKYDFEDVWEANARRIVACVNACAGIDTEIIERNANKVSDLLTQRDELLAICKDLVHAHGYCSYLSDEEKQQDELIVRANAAIAKAEQP